MFVSSVQFKKTAPPSDSSQGGRARLARQSNWINSGFLHNKKVLKIYYL